MAEFESLLADVRRLADMVGPALLRAGHGELLQSVADTARHLLGAAACSLALLDEAQENLVYEVASGVGAAAVVGLRLPLDKGIAGWVAVSGQPMAVSDVQRDPRFAKGFAAETGYLPTSLLAMPMQTARGVVGVLTILDAEEHASMDLLASFAEQAALAIETGQTFARFGQLLLRTAGDAADGDLRTALRSAAQASPSDPSDIDEHLARQVLAVAACSESDRMLAAQLLQVLVMHKSAEVG